MTPNEQLLSLLYAFYQDIMQFELSPRFDAKGSYSGRKSEELDAIKHRYQTAVDHLQLARHAP